MGVPTQGSVSIASAAAACVTGSVPERDHYQSLLLRPVQFILHPQERQCDQGNQLAGIAAPEIVPIVRHLPPASQLVDDGDAQMSVSDAKHPTPARPNHQTMPL